MPKLPSLSEKRSRPRERDSIGACCFTEPRYSQKLPDKRPGPVPFFDTEGQIGQLPEQQRLNVPRLALLGATEIIQKT